MFRPCFFAPQRSTRHTRSRSTPRRRDAPRRARPNGCDQSSGCCLFRRVYSGDGEVIPVGITATEAK